VTSSPGSPDPLQMDLTKDVQAWKEFCSCRADQGQFCYWCLPEAFAGPPYARSAD